MGVQSQVRGPTLGWGKVRQGGNGHRSPPRCCAYGTVVPSPAKLWAAEGSHSGTCWTRQDGLSRGQHLRWQESHGGEGACGRGSDGHSTEMMIVQMADDRRVFTRGHGRPCNFLQWVPAARPDGWQETLGSAHCHRGPDQRPPPSGSGRAASA